MDEKNKSEELSEEQLETAAAGSASASFTGPNPDGRQGGMGAEAGGSDLAGEQFGTMAEHFKATKGTPDLKSVQYGYYLGQKHKSNNFRLAHEGFLNKSNSEQAAVIGAWADWA